MQSQRTCPQCEAPIGPRAAQCKKCAGAAYKREHADRIREQNRAYELANRAAVNARHRRWWQEHRLEQNAKVMARYYADPSRQRERSRTWKTKSRLRLRKQARALYAANPQRHIQYARDHQRRYPDQKHERDHRWRVRRLAAFVERVAPLAIYERDGWKCQICGKPVKRGQQSLDHVVPISRGGTHEASNVRLAHRRCNTRRGNRGPAQLLLFG